MPSCTVHLRKKQGMEYGTMVVIGPPEEISKAYRTAQIFLCLQVMRTADGLHWVLTNQLIVANHCELVLARIYAKTADGICISNLDI